MQTRYRYTLENFETMERFDATQRNVRFTTLAPGNYVFRVQARTNRGTCSEKNGPSVRIRILPPWWGTWQFKMDCAMSMCLALWVVYQIRVWQVAHQLHLRFEERLQERTRIAVELRDTLLLGF